MKKDKVKQLLALLGICTLPIIATAFSGCGIKQKFTCQMCGSSKTYTPVYAHGTTTDGTTSYEYTSCVGPAGCVGFGCNTVCWPTECMYVKETQDNQTVNGAVYYYDKVGCIGCSEEGNDSLSKGRYTQSFTCLGITCASDIYVEEINEDKNVAYNQSSCLGCDYGEKEYVENKDLNAKLKRKYKQGCASACYEEQE